MSVKSFFSDLFSTRERITADRTILIPGETAGHDLLCPHCQERADHDPRECKPRGMSRRMFGLSLGAAVAGSALQTATKTQVGMGLFGANSQQLAQRLDGVPLPTTRVQVVARAGDVFKVDTLNPFTLAFEKATNRFGHSFKTTAGILQEGGLLEFHGQDLARPDKWLRVHESLGEMNVLGLVDKVTGKPVPYKIIRNKQAAKIAQAATAEMLQKMGEAAQAPQDFQDALREFVTRPTVIEMRAHPAVVAAKTKQVPVDSERVERQGVRRVTVKTSLGDFRVKYTAGLRKYADTVCWEFLGKPMPSPSLTREYNTFEGVLLRPMKIENKSLHQAISQLNEHYPEDGGTHLLGDLSGIARAGDHIDPTTTRIAHELLNRIFDDPRMLRMTDRQAAMSLSLSLLRFMARTEYYDAVRYEALNRGAIEV